MDIFIFVIAATFVNFTFGLPDLSWDTKSEDILHLMKQSEVDYIRSLRKEMEDMPLHCRPGGF